MNDLDGLPLLQGHLVLQEGSVGFDGDVGLTWRGEGQSVKVYLAWGPPLWAWGFLQLSPLLMQGPWTSALCPLYPGEPTHSHPPPPTAETWPGRRCSRPVTPELFTSSPLLACGTAIPYLFQFLKRNHKSI